MVEVHQSLIPLKLLFFEELYTFLDPETRFDKKIKRNPMACFVFYCSRY